MASPDALVRPPRRPQPAVALTWRPLLAIRAVREPEANPPNPCATLGKEPPGRAKPRVDTCVLVPQVTRGSKTHRQSCCPLTTKNGNSLTTQSDRDLSLKWALFIKREYPHSGNRNQNFLLSPLGVVLLDTLGGLVTLLSRATAAVEAVPLRPMSCCQTALSAGRLMERREADARLSRQVSRQPWAGLLLYVVPRPGASL